MEKIIYEKDVWNLEDKILGVVKTNTLFVTNYSSTKIGVFLQATLYVL